MPERCGNIQDKIIGLQGMIRGRYAEERFQSLVSSSINAGDFPWYVTGVAKANQREDSEGVDAWIYTANRGKVGIQIKYSEGGANSFRYKRPHIPVVVVNPSLNDAKVLESSLNILFKKIEVERDNK